MYRCTASVTISLPKEAIFAALSDYNSYQQWLPGVSHSRVLAREGDICIAEFVWPQLMKDERFVLEFIASPPHTIVYVQTDQDRRRGLSGKWEIKDAPTGDNEVLLSGEMTLRVPFYRAFAARRRMHAALASFLSAIADRARFAAFEEEAEKKKIIEVIRRHDGVRVRLFGETYELKKL